MSDTILYIYQELKLPLVVTRNVAHNFCLLAVLPYPKFSFVIFTKCSGDKSFTSLNAKPVKMQKTKMSRTCSTRLIVNSLARMNFNLVHRQKFGISFFQFEAVVSKWIFLYPVVFQSNADNLLQIL